MRYIRYPVTVIVSLFVLSCLLLVSQTSAYAASATGASQYTLSIGASGPGSTNPSGSRTYNGGTVVTITATPSSGSRFDRWAGSVSSTSPTITITMNGNKSVTAYFVPVQYTLSIGVSGQGNTNPAAGSRSCNQGSQVAITAIASSGWKFDHWACDASGTNPSTTILMNGNKSVTACFSQTTVVANYITTIKYQGKTYYVQVIPSGNQAQVWFRLDPNACNSGDFELIVTMQGYLNQTATQVKKLVCSGYNLYDSGKTWLDCGSVLLSVATCSGTVTGVADVVSVGTIADACVVSTNYVITKGAKDCIEGVTGIIAKYLGQSNAFSAYQITTATTKTDLIEATLGAWCEN